MRKKPAIYDVFTDASVCTNRNVAGLGWVIFQQPEEGRFVKAGAKRLEGKAARKTNLCEIYAVSEALRKTARHSAVNLHCDDQDIVKLISNPAALQKRIEKSKPLLMQAYKNLQEAMNRHFSITVSKSSPAISRFFNEAHNLAKMGASLTKDDIRLCKRQFREERAQKIFQISLYI